jgi:Flp pilus assembly pilin Flp
MAPDRRRHRTFPLPFPRTPRNVRGQTLVEYILVIVVVALVLIAAMKIFQGNLSTIYTDVASSVSRPP